ncbi:AzlC family ABC transporter permease [Campylobacter troglodytis]|uniref:AzlC family ABC transporter permease n=1 Tax=Campylobacter troglodytis TaxID=654363 RepID=UPI00115BA0E6|nr:AzlC family ABC transporter permease [Campylobacter troglodytis]TQR60241.1 branched-chain amino acid permease [Campylobacter troglodytis]
MRYIELFKLSLPVMMGYVPLGVALGILAASNELSLAQSLAISFFVYSGSAEFLLVVFIAMNEGLLGVFVSLFLVSFRHFFYTLSLLNELRGLNFLRYYVIYALSDESFALLCAYKERFFKDRLKRSLSFFLICALNQSYWLLGVSLGWCFQRGFNFDYSGIEFSLNALFIVIAYDAYRQNPNFKLFLVGAIIGLFGFLFIAKSYMLFTCLILALFLLLLGRRYV